MGKMDCVIPVTLESNVVTLHQFLYGEDALYSPSSTVKKIGDHIAEESGFYEGGKAAPTSSGSGKSDSKGQSSGNSKRIHRHLPRQLPRQQLAKVLRRRKQ